MESTKAKASWELSVGSGQSDGQGNPLTVAYQMAFATQLGSVGGIRAGL